MRTEGSKEAGPQEEKMIGRGTGSMALPNFYKVETRQLGWMVFAEFSLILYNSLAFNPVMNLDCELLSDKTDTWTMISYFDQ